jgi:hypothetical protein
MSSPEDRLPLIPPEGEMPEFQLNVDNTAFLLRWDNVEIICFDVGDGEFDHLLHKVAEDQYVYIFFIRLDDPSIREQLEALRFIRVQKPMLDPQTRDMYVNFQARKLENFQISDLLDSDTV